MAASTLRDAAILLDAGLLDDNFKQLQEIVDDKFLVDVITLFCKDGERIIGELAKQLEKTCVDFNKTVDFVHQLRGSSATVGARRVNNNCNQLHEFCREKSRDGCLKTLDALKNNFYDLRSKFQTMIQLEQQGQASYPKK
uniref:Uncharacterized protein n=1 Tax=Avena sativa TaxID=4498 RepID=A0ACD6ALA2_AVESA